MPADEPSDIEATAAEHRSSLLRPIVAGVVALGVVAAVLVVVVWWRRGGPRRAVKELAEEGAVALADAIVDEVFPAA
jgi:hypothetical protein